jgi:O-antigen/teichoic acid export membrane protein
MFFLVKYLNPKDVGVYGLMVATIGIATYFLGMDFYVFNTREILAQESSERSLLIRDQFVFHLLAYAVVLPLLLTIFYVRFLPWRLIGWFYSLLVLEHLSQEIYRVLIALSKPVLANIILFFRAGIWVYLLLGMIYFLPHLRSVEWVFALWNLGVMISVFLGFFSLREMEWRSVCSTSVQWRWILNGLKTSSMFFLSTLMFLVMQHASRYFLKYHHGEAAVGVFTFYSSIANVLEVFIFTSVFSIFFPKIISAYQGNRFQEYKLLVKKMSILAIGFLVLLVAMAFVGIYPVLKIINKPIYEGHIKAYWILLVSVFFVVLGQIFNYLLYARKMDTVIVGSAGIAFLVAIIANVLLVPGRGIEGASMATCIAMFVLWVTRGIYLEVRR